MTSKNLSTGTITVMIYSFSVLLYNIVQRTDSEDVLWIRIQMDLQFFFLAGNGTYTNTDPTGQYMHRHFFSQITV